jgi:cytochrome c-type biogenesis protein CcmF
MLIGIITSTVYDRSEPVVLPRGQVTGALGYRFIWQGERPLDGGTKTAYDIEVLTADNRSFLMNPVMFFSAYTNGIMRRPAIRRFASRDLYLSPQGVDRDEALDQMDRREVTLAKGETASVDSTIIRFEAFETRAMTEQVIEIAARLVVTAGGRTETVTPVLRATPEGQSYGEAKVGSDGSKIVMRKVDAQNGRAVFYIRQPGSMHYELPIEALYLEVSVKPFIMILWIGTFLCIGGLIMTVIYRARSASRALRPAVTEAPAPAEAVDETPAGAEAGAAVGA